VVAPVVVTDTGPPHYLALIGAVHLLPQLFDTVVVPDLVRNELRHLRTPKSVRDWLATDPPWLKAVPTAEVASLPLPKLGDGERAAIALARSIQADLILMDDRAATAVALQEGFKVTGTLGVLARAAQRDLINLTDAFLRLKATNFRYRPEILDALSAQHAKRDT
jgi:predicted nucleic acid-binding protein